MFEKGKIRSLSLAFKAGEKGEKVFKAWPLFKYFSDLAIRVIDENQRSLEAFEIIIIIIFFFFSYTEFFFEICKTIENPVPKQFSCLSNAF